MFPNDGCSIQAYKWAIGYKCDSCNAVRYMCDLCIHSDNTMVRRTLHHRSRLCRHHRLYHADSVRPCKKSKVNEIDSNVMDPSQDKKSIHLETAGLTYCEPVDCYDNTTSYEYFKRNSDPNNPCKGPAYMVGLAISGTASGYEQLHENDIILHLLLSKFVSNLTRNQRVELGFILEMILKSTKTNKKNAAILMIKMMTMIIKMSLLRKRR